MRATETQRLSDSACIILLPGLGADGRMFEPQRLAFPGLQTPEWIAHRAAESLADYARRMAATIDPPPRFYLGGASFGGMVALEMARHIRPKAVFLIGSCRSGRQLPWALRFWYPFGRAIPDAMVRLAGRLPVRDWARILQAGPQHAVLFRDMLRQVSIPFLRWGHRAIVQWDGVAELPIPVCQIHGREDRFIPVRCTEPDAVVNGAGHLLSLTHPEEVNAFIRAWVS